MNEVEFGFRIRQALNEGADALDYKTSFRLERARLAALGRQPAPRPATVCLPALQLAAAGGAPVDAPGGVGLWAWLRGVGVLAPLVVLAIGFVGIYQWHNRQHIEQLADVDFAVLLDETPIEAYADRGFGALLQRDGIDESAFTASQ
jgi:Protein of unknown function (DUF3619)